MQRQVAVAFPPLKWDTPTTQEPGGSLIPAKAEAIDIGTMGNDKEDPAVHDFQAKPKEKPPTAGTTAQETASHVCMCQRGTFQIGGFLFECPFKQLRTGILKK